MPPPADWLAPGFADDAAGELEDWQKDALDEYGDALYRRAVRKATKVHRGILLGPSRLRLRRARSTLGGRRRPGARRSARSASRSAGGGDPDQPGPGEAGGQLLATLLQSPRGEAR